MERQTTRRHILRGSNPHTQNLENFKHRISTWAYLLRQIICCNKSIQPLLPTN